LKPVKAIMHVFAVDMALRFCMTKTQPQIEQVVLMCFIFIYIYFTLSAGEKFWQTTNKPTYLKPEVLSSTWMLVHVPSVASSRISIKFSGAGRFLFLKAATKTCASTKKNQSTKQHNNFL